MKSSFFLITKLSKVCFIISLIIIPGCTTLYTGKTIVNSFTGYASWYGKEFHGKKTASGEIFNMNALTAAHRKLPFGTYVLVTNLSNNKKVIVRINDRGPFYKKRIIDLSKKAAEKIGLTKVGKVKIEILQ